LRSIAWLIKAARTIRILASYRMLLTFRLR
jgi:hypothetical protein